MFRETGVYCISPGGTSYRSPGFRSCLASPWATICRHYVAIQTLFCDLLQCRRLENLWVMTRAPLGNACSGALLQMGVRGAFFKERTMRGPRLLPLAFRSGASGTAFSAQAHLRPSRAWERAEGKRGVGIPACDSVHSKFKRHGDPVVSPRYLSSPRKWGSREFAK